MILDQVTRKGLRIILPVSFALGAGMELFMIKVAVGDDVAVEKELERMEARNYNKLNEEQR
eukprot:maker-scaffold_6-snap-gene-3.45-mRNA-1 protein AED:0.05 eAED:0.24 QI:0/0/0.5/1/1/1/2/350/60